MEQCDVIYKISLDCDSSYVSQTKRKAKMRIKEHKANIKKLKDSLTVLHSIRLKWSQNKLGQYANVRYTTI